MFREDAYVGHDAEIETDAAETQRAAMMGNCFLERRAGCIVCFPLVADDAGDGREIDEEAQRVGGVEVGVEIPGPLNLGPVGFDLLRMRHGFVEAVAKGHSEFEYAFYRGQIGSTAFEGGAECGFVTDLGAVSVYFCA